MKSLKSALAWVLCIALFSHCSFFLPNDSEDSETSPTDRPVASIQTTTKKKVLVLPFINQTSYDGQPLSNFATDEITDALSRLTDISVFNKTIFDDEPQFIRPDQTYDYPEIIAQAKSLGIAAAVLGWIEQIQTKDRGEEVGIFRARFHTVTATVRVQIIDISTQREILFRKATESVEEEFTQIFSTKSDPTYNTSRGKSAILKSLQTIETSFPTITRRIAWVGRIAKIETPRLFINAGEDTGLRKGQYLKVYEDNRPVYDPETGSLLGAAQGRYKGLLKIVDLIGKDGAVAVAQSGNDFTPQDIVELYVPQN